FQIPGSKHQNSRGSRKGCSVEHRSRRKPIEGKKDKKDSTESCPQTGSSSVLFQIRPQKTHFLPPLLNEISHAELGGDEPCKPCPVQLFPQPVHIDAQGVFIHIAVCLPEALHQPFPAHHFSPAFHQSPQD